MSSFLNKVRLPINLSKPQFPTERTQFTKANGITQTLTASIRKTYQGETDNIPEKWHQRLIVALNHDYIFVTSQRYIGEITLDDGNYNISWPDFKDYPLGKAEFVARATPFDAVNMNCSTCEELTQLDLADDNLGSINVGDTVNINVFANDDICCSPITAEIVSYNSTYVESASIDELTGILTLKILANAYNVTDKDLVVYRVTCPNGGYDEATGIGTVIGGLTPDPCPTPSNLQVTDTDTNGATIEIDDLSVGMMRISTCANPDVVIWEGSVTTQYPLTTTIITADYVSLNADTCYRAEFWNDCYPEPGISAFIDFTTDEVTGPETCGQFSVFNNGPIGCSITYLDCANVEHILYLLPQHTLTLCCKTTVPGTPDKLISGCESFTVKTYLGPC